MSQAGFSYWEKETFFMKTDYLIVGSGIVGLNAAITLKHRFPDARVVVLEQGMVPTGASTRNAGFACFGSISELEDDLNQSTVDDILSLVEKRWAGLQRLLGRVGTQKMNFLNLGGYELFRKEDQSSFATCSESLGFWNQKIDGITGMKDTYVLADEQIRTFGFQGIDHLILNRAEGQIHTGKMMAALLDIAIDSGVRIFNGATVDQIQSHGSGVDIQLTDGKQFRSAKVLVATNGFAKRLMPELAVTPARNQVLITKPVADLKVKGTFHYDKGYYYFRNVGNRILFGGGRNLSPQEEMTDAFGTTNLIQNRLVELMEQVILPDTSFEVDMWWSGILGVGDIKRPIVKLVDDHVAVAVRMGGMGVAIGSLIGEEGADLISI